MRGHEVPHQQGDVVGAPESAPSSPGGGEASTYRLETGTWDKVRRALNPDFRDPMSVRLRLRPAGDRMEMTVIDASGADLGGAELVRESGPSVGSAGTPVSAPPASAAPPSAAVESAPPPDGGLYVFPMDAA